MINKIIPIIVITKGIRGKQVAIHEIILNKNQTIPIKKSIAPIIGYLLTLLLIIFFTAIFIF
jgi:hypothetical protein